MKNNHSLTLLLGLAVLASLYPLQSLARFMIDASDTDHAVAPHVRNFDDESMERPFFPKHCCFTCYVVASELALAGEGNIYDPEHYRNPAQPTHVHEAVGELLNIDRYQYPPPFLLLPWALERVGGGFWGARKWFFFLNLGAFAVCLFCIQLWLRSGAKKSTAEDETSWSAGRTWLAWPLVLLPLTTMTTLQIGNVHALVMVLAILGMLAVRTGQAWIGGALLGFLTVGKIFPGLLLVYLFARGEKRAVLWSLGFGALYCLLSLWLFGPAPFEAFFTYQLGRLASAEAFRFAFEIPRAMLVNSSFSGIPYRLQELGLLSGVGEWARSMTWIIGFVLLVLAWIVGRMGRGRSSSPGLNERHAELGLWLALLLLAQMRSPFLPWGYGSFVVLWLLATLIGAPSKTGAWRLRGLVLLITAGVVGTSLPLPIGGPNLTPDFYFALLGTSLALLLACVAVLRAWRVARATPRDSDCC